MFYLITYPEVDLSPGPIGWTLTNNTIAPNAGNNTIIGNLAVQGGTGPFTWTQTDPRFKFSSSTGSTVSYERSGVGSLTPGSTVGVTIRVTDAASLFFEKPQDILVDTVPTLITLSPSDIASNAPDGQIVGFLGTVGGVSPFVYSALDNPKFQLSGGTLLRRVAGGNLSGNTTEVGNVTSTDDNSETVTTQLSILIDPPVTSGLPTPPSNPTEGVTLSWNGAGNPTIAPVQEGPNGSWKITATTSAFTSLLNTTYASLQNVYNATSVIANCTCHIPQGQFITIGVLCSLAGSIYSWQGSGQFLTMFKGATNATAFFTCKDDSATARFYIRDMWIGPFPADIAANPNIKSIDNSLVIKMAALVVCDHVTITRNFSNGIQGDEYFLWTQMENLEFWGFDMEISICGGDPLQHNIYIHNMRRVFLQRVFSHTSNGHALKADAQRTDCIDCTFAGRYDTNAPAGYGNNAPAVNATRNTDLFLRNCLIMPNYTQSVSAALIMATRDETGGYVGRKTPPYYAKHTTVDARQITWFYGGVGPATSETCAGISDAAYPGNSTRVGFEWITPMTAQVVGGTQATDLNDTGAHGYDVQVKLANGNVHSSSATRFSSSKVSPPKPAPQIGQQGRFVCDLDLAIPGNTTVLKSAPAIFKRNGNSTQGTQNWDFVVQDATTSQRHNKNDPLYYWPRITTGGVLDLTKSNLPDGIGFYVAFCQDTFIIPISSTTAGATIYSQAADDNVWIFCGTGSTNLYETPLSPLNSNVGAWGNVAGAGMLDNQLHTGSPILGPNGTGGTGISGSDCVQTDMFISYSFNYYDQHLTTDRIATQFIGLAPTNSQPQTTGRGKNVFNYVNTSGAVVPVGQSGKFKPLPATIQWTTSSQTNPLGNILIVSSGTGFSTSMRGSVEGTDGNGNPRSHAFDIVNVSTNHITISPAIPSDLTIQSGARGSITIKPGPIPNGVLLPEDFHGYTP